MFIKNTNNSIYKLIGKLYHGGELVGYRLMNIVTSSEHDMSLSEVRLLASQNMIQGVLLNSKGSLRGTSGTDLRKVPRISVYKGNLSTFELEYNIQEKFHPSLKLRKRYCFARLWDYLNKDSNSKICLIYGLRRTGKTVMMLQAIQNLGYKFCAYISLNYNDKSRELLHSLDYCYNKGIKYVFIDEITALEDVLRFIQTLSDNYAMRGMHIVVAGTDSYLLKIASKNVLYDRYFLIRTSYISYSEYGYLLGTGSISEYIHYGGVLNKDAFYDVDSMHRYMDTAVGDNIAHSVYAAGRRVFGRFYDIIDEGMFKRYLELAVQYTNEDLSVGILKKEFMSKDLGSVRQLLLSRFDLDDMRVVTLGENYSRNTALVEEHFDTFKGILSGLDLIVYINHYLGNKRSEDILFTMVGLRYNQLIEVFNALISDDKFIDLSVEDKKLILSRLRNDVYGQLAEQVVLLEMLNRFGMKNVCKFNGTAGEEIDCVVTLNNGLILIEVKWSKSVVQHQCTHLLNNEFNGLIEKVIGYRVKKRMVVYRGNSKVVTFNGIKIYYVNIELFLSDISNYISADI